MGKTQIEIMEEATAQVALNLFNLKHPDLEASDPSNQLMMEECVSDTVFIVNNFMRITSDIVRKDMIEDQAQ